MSVNVQQPPKKGNKTVDALRSAKSELKRRHGSLHETLALADFESVILELKSRAHSWDALDAESADYDSGRYV